MNKAIFHSNIVVDFGNTSIKVGEFVESELIQDWVFDNVSELLSLIATRHHSSILLCSVSKNLHDFVKKTDHPKINILSASTPIPFENHYKSKHTLGLDRIAVMAGAEFLFSGHNCLVIDMGTCITYDLLDADRNYFGGIISPGVNMRFEAMHHFTEKLPLVSPSNKVDLVGTTTKEAIRSGVINGITAEMEGFISRYQSKWTDLQVVVCGGDSKCFESKLKEHIFAAPKLVLIGLNRILEYNEKS